MGTGKKVLWQTALTQLEGSDVEGLGQVREDEKGSAYRWVKNSSITALVAGGCCLMDFTTTAADIFKRVRATHLAQTGPSTCLITMPAGVPLTAIAESGGTSTGDHGWIQVAGIKKLSIQQTATAANQSPGCRAIATSVGLTYAEWGQAITSVIGSITVNQHNYRCITLASPLATTGVFTCASAICQVRCL